MAKRARGLPSILVVVFVKNLLDLRHEGWQIIMDDLPDDFTVDDVVPVNQDIAERDDPRAIAYSCCALGIHLQEAVDRLPDDLEVPLHCLLEKPVTAEVIECLACDARQHKGAGIADVLQQFRGIMLHRGVSDSC